MQDKSLFEIRKRALRKLGLIYGAILAFINAIGYVVVVVTKIPVGESSATLAWAAFKVDHRAFIVTAMLLLFQIPFILLIYYVLHVNEKNVASRIINLPSVYALVGGIGWVLPYVFELFCLIYVAIHDQEHMHSIGVMSFLNVLQSALFIGTFSFMALDAAHRRYVLPKYFPDGKLNTYPGTKQFSTKGMIRIFYLSVGLLPVIYLLTVLSNYSYSVGFEVSIVIYVVAFAFVAAGYVMMRILSRYFTRPLGKLKKATEDIKNEDYEEKIDVVSNDDFGILADNFNDMALALDEKSQKIVAIQDSIIKGMAVMVESNDNSTGGHIIRTSDCVKIFVEQLRRSGYRPDIPSSYWKKVIKAAPMHDLGKIAIDDSVLRKPGKFTPEEYEIMKRHPAEGARIVEQVLSEVDDDEFKQIAINVAHYHHEKWNGTGYPTGISREEIPLEARIMALADVFDALVSKRCYKESMSFDEAFCIIEESLGTHFDPELGLIFLKCRPQLEALYQSEEYRK